MGESISDRDWARQAFQGAGLRATSSRVATLLVLRDAVSPMTHAEVADRLSELAMDRATVFRNLTDMTSAKLLRRTELCDHVWRFELIRGDEHAAHPHFVCVDCGAVSCLEEIELTPKSQAVSSQLGQVTEILLRGHCRNCV